jgi:hypothetical protein
MWVPCKDAEYVSSGVLSLYHAGVLSMGTK